ncbi:MAG: glycerophosphodiester phosphodiesterase family protein [Candidatus Neomarinimicrobiota bacterium]
MKTKNTAIPSNHKKLPLLISCLCLFLLHNCTDRGSLPDRGVCAHRGASNTHPENTLSAFKEAIRLGAQMIEFDVRMTIDSFLVVIHDDSLERTTNGQGKVSEKSLSELLSLDAGSWKDLKFSGEKIPLFSEVIDIMPRNTWLNIHIKGDQETAYRAAGIIEAKNRMHQAIFACKLEAANTIRQVNDSLILCNMERLESAEEYVDSTIAMKYDFIQLKTRADTTLSDLIGKLKENNIRINYFETDSKDKFKSLISEGIDFTLTDNLSELIEVAKEFDVEPVRPKY